jgi:uncharacterized protein (TIGR02172 family)
MGVQVSPGEPIAEGRTAEIYAWREGWVLKLFREWCPAEDVRYEAQLARAAALAVARVPGLSVPAVGETVELEGRLGLEYERVDGEMMWSELAERPWSLLRLARVLAELHLEMHAIEDVAGLPDQQERLERKIRGAEGLHDVVAQASLQALEEMPRGNRLCHGDFHPANVLMTGQGPVVIDWIDATVGNPLADVARTTILLEGFLATDTSVSRFQQALIALLHRVYLRHYFARRGGGRDEYRRWLPLVAAARLSEGIEELQDWLAARAGEIGEYGYS